MKTAINWVCDHSQNAPFDGVRYMFDAETLVKAIQADALRHAASLVHPDGSPEVAIERINDAADKLISP